MASKEQLPLLSRWQARNAAQPARQPVHLASSKPKIATTLASSIPRTATHSPRLSTSKSDSSTIKLASLDRYRPQPRTPRLLIQYGQPRTGSTQQFQCLCVILHLLKPTLNVECKTGVANSSTAGIPSTYALSSSHAAVIKTHSGVPNHLGEHQSAWLFATASSESEVQRLRSAHPANSAFPLKYVQFMAELSRRGYTLAAEYRSVFGLSDEQASQLVEYMQPWEVLRQCCGKQMSEIYRAQLQHRTPSYVSGPDPGCSAYNLDEVEQQLLQTDVYRRHSHRSRTLRAVSNIDDELNGTYCRNQNARIVRLRLGQNDLPLDKFLDKGLTKG